MAIKLKFRTAFPALVEALSPLTLVKNGLKFIFGIDINALKLSLDPFYSTVLVPGGNSPRSLAQWAADLPFIEDFGGGVGVADNTPAHNLAYANGNGYKFRTGGSYTFATAPGIMSKDFFILGAEAGGVQTTVTRTYSEATPTRGLFSWTAGQAYISNLKILSFGSGVTGGAAVSLIPSVAPAAAMFVSLSDVRITAAGSGVSTWAYSIYADGSALTSPLGLRSACFKNVTCFGATTRAVFLKSVVHFDWFGGSVDSAGGTDGSLEITGTVGVVSQDGIVQLDYIDGNLVLDQCSTFAIDVGRIKGNVLNTVNTAYVNGKGRIQAGPQSNWTSSIWQEGSFLWLATGVAISWGGGDVTINNSANVLGFSGASVGGYTFDFTVYPVSNDVAALGTPTLSWSDLFLASGGVIGWNNGDVTITHAADALTLAGAANGYTFTKNAAAPASAAITGVVTRAIGVDGATARIALESYGTGVATAFSANNLRRANGTAAVPSAVQSGDLLFGYVGTGYGTSTFLDAGGAGMLGWASQTATNAAGGTELAFVVTPNGAIANAEALRILNSGQIKLTGAANAAANGSVATVLGSLGPVGSHTTVQEWLAVTMPSGNVRWFPGF